MMCIHGLTGYALVCGLIVGDYGGDEDGGG